MITEVRDAYVVLESVHRSIDKMLEGLTDQQLLEKPFENMNNIASIVEHTTLVEKRFLSSLAGDVQTIDSQKPFQTSTWDVSAIKQQWEDVLRYAKEVFEKLEQSDMEQPGLKLGIGELNKRQLMLYTIAHTTHHRGQIPIVKKFLKNE